MANPTPNVSSKYGAPMGRKSDHLSGLIVDACDSPFTLRRIRLDSGGYDQGGSYWGHYKQLYWWAVTITEGDAVDECSGFMRATSRQDAKRQILELQPNARFFR
jgi:hypothetical protein